MGFGDTAANNLIDPQIQAIVEQLTQEENAKNGFVRDIAKSAVNPNELMGPDRQYINGLTNRNTEEQIGNIDQTLAGLNEQVSQLEGYKPGYADAMQAEDTREADLHGLKMQMIKDRFGREMAGLNEQGRQASLSNNMAVQGDELRRKEDMSDFAAAQKNLSAQADANKIKIMKSKFPEWREAAKTVLGDAVYNSLRSQIIADKEAGRPINEILSNLQNAEPDPDDPALSGLSPEEVQKKLAERKAALPKIKNHYFADVLYTYKGPGQRKTWMPGDTLKDIMRADLLPQQSSARNHRLSSDRYALVDVLDSLGAISARSHRTKALDLFRSPSKYSHHAPPVNTGFLWKPLSARNHRTKASDLLQLSSKYSHHAPPVNTDFLLKQLPAINHRTKTLMKVNDQW